MTPLYQLKLLRMNYGGRNVLAIDDLTVEAGALHLLTGANGSGKSTLLAILALLSPPTTGELWYNGNRVEWKNGALRNLRLGITLLHQTPYLFRGNVQSNIAFGLRVRGITGAPQQRLIEEALEMVGLAGFQKRPARELSGGETQRVAMARALALKPQVLLLDEPLANVDSETADLLEQVVVSLPKLGTTVIMTTHDPSHPERFSANRIHLVSGWLVEPGQTFTSSARGDVDSCQALPKREKSSLITASPLASSG